MINDYQINDDWDSSYCCKSLEKALEDKDLSMVLEMRFGFELKIDFPSKMDPLPDKELYVIRHGISEKKRKNLRKNKMNEPPFNMKFCPFCGKDLKCIWVTP